MFENLGQASKKFYYKCSENSRSQNVFRTDIFRKLTLDAPEKKAIEILAFAPLFTYWTSWFAIRDSVGDILQITGAMLLT